MKLAVVILAGAADGPIGSLSDRTPLAAADLPALSDLAARGRTGGVRTIPPKAPVALETALLSILGRDPAATPVAAGGILASALQVSLDPGERAFRADLVNLYDGAVVDPTAGRIDDAQAGILFAMLEEELGTPAIRIRAGDRWRGLLVVGEGQADTVRTVSPSSILGESVEAHRPGGRGANVVRGIMGRAAELLERHEINLVRVDLGENPANGLVVWGGGRPTGREPRIPGAAVSSHPSLLGLARETGMAPVRTGAGADPEEEAKRVAAAAADELARHDLVVAMVESPLVASRIGDVAGKLAALEAADRELVLPLSERVLGEGGRLLVLASHEAGVESRRESGGVLPFVLAGEGAAMYGESLFTEKAARESDLVVDRGHELLEYATKS